jgi:hypothetical protein
MSHLGNFFHDQRVNQCLSLGQLARMVGYRNVSKGANRIVRFEREGTVTEDLLAALADALGIDLQTVKGLIDQDRTDYLEAWEAWVNEQVPMQLIARYMPAVYGRVKFPEEITTAEQAEAFASEYAKQHGRRVCLSLSRRHSVWIDAQGQVEARTEATPNDPNVPFMQLKGSRTRFLMNFGCK